MAVVVRVPLLGGQRYLILDGQRRPRTMVRVYPHAVVIGSRRLGIDVINGPLRPIRRLILDQSAAGGSPQASRGCDDEQPTPVRVRAGTPKRPLVGAALPRGRPQRPAAAQAGRGRS